ncbi:GNAT family N-acetyltransferase [Streptomyces sp. NPDC050418]|uniref:GNAT family N-acetyltransferase n=1 Tax=Streptomyces sp. NPDC050418 TaxID=3365612 RepID=UPI00378FD1EC
MDDSTTTYLATGPRVGLRRLTYADGEVFVALARESRELHHPWLAPPVTAEQFALYAQRLIEDPARAGFLICERGVDEGHEPARGRIAGYVNINNIVEGAFRNGALGYGAFAHAAGQGLMSEGLRLLITYAFGPALGLHRLEINVQPDNAASIALARRCGFRLEGFSPDFLYIDGAWRDHERWALTREMVR